ncbi:MAG: hypothetical protein M4579_000199 [Chaenotheca gracillima]|nr:MAG: hypothetical protein M4579_000199 [Chaenotheca gracillima]
MLLNLVAIVPLVLNALGNPLPGDHVYTAVALPSETPSLGETVFDLVYKIPTNDLQTYPFVNGPFNQSSNGTGTPSSNHSIAAQNGNGSKVLPFPLSDDGDAPEVTTKSPESDDSARRDLELLERSFESTTRKEIVTSWTSDSMRFNLSVAGNICADTPVGHFVSPRGAVSEDATLSTIHDAMKLPSSILYNYTLTTARGLASKINTTLDEALCGKSQGSTERELLQFTRRQAEDVDGFWTATVVKVFGGSGLAFGLFLVAINETHTVYEQAGAIAAITGAGVLANAVIDRLVQRQYLSSFEAFIINSFLCVCENLYNGWKATIGGTCATAATAWDGVKRLGATVSNVLHLTSFDQAQRARLSSTGASSTNLVGMDGSAHGSEQYASSVQGGGAVESC